jgi:hypothetical protein
VKEELMKGKKSSIVSILVLSALLASGCQALAPPPPVVMEEYISENCGIRTVAPQDWTSYLVGELYRGEWPEDLASLRFLYYPGKTSDWVFSTVLLPVVGMDEVPESDSSLDSGTWSWQLYEFLTVDIGIERSLFVDIALAETEGGTYTIGLTSSRRDYDYLHEAVFVPAVEAAEPVSYESRDRLTAEDLISADHQMNSPVNNIYYTPMGEAAPALHTLEGTLSVPGFRMQDSLPEEAGLPEGTDYFPGFSVGFFTYQDYLVPAVRDILPAASGRSYWDIILSPGKIWSESGDNGMSRGSFPFLLIAEHSNEAHNGIATFLFDDNQVSSIAVQVIQETAAWRRFDWWGQSPMEYEPESLENGEDLVARFAEEVEQQLPIRPWSDLEEEYGSQALAGFDINLEPADISATGLVMASTIYLKPCYTRYGEFPYCRYMRHASFSVAKSMGAAVAMLWLAQEYGPDVFDLRIADYVDVTAEHDGWDQVTFGDALNMATGVGNTEDSSVFTADEDEDRFGEFMEAGSARSKLEVCFSYGDYSWGPGEVTRYNSINTFVLSVAMQSYLESMEGPDADIWEMVIEKVYEPIGIYYAPIMRTYELDGSKGVPIFGYGLYPTVEEVARVSMLMQNGGQYEGEQLLHPELLAEALYRTDVTGLPRGESNEYGEGTYHMSFWSTPYRSTGGDFYLVPYMTGFGGNHVALMPNGITTFRFADAHKYGTETMIEAAESILPFSD